MQYFLIIAIIALLGQLLVFNNTTSDLKKETMTTKQMMYVVNMSVIAIVVGFFEVPIGFIGVKLDFSEVVILISILMLGYKNASLVIILRSLVRFFLPSKTAMEADYIWKFLGEVIAILASYLIILSYYITTVIFKKKQKPLIYALPTNVKKTSISEFITCSLLSSIILTIGMTVFHTIITMPMFMSGYSHLTIFSLLSDPKYSSESVLSIVKTIIIMFGLVNVIKGIISPALFLIIKPKIESVVK